MTERGWRLAADCPLCHAPIQLRRNRQTGELFLGCSAYPVCRFAEAYNEDLQALVTACLWALLDQSQRVN